MKRHRLNIALVVFAACVWLLLAGAARALPLTYFDVSSIPSGTEYDDYGYVTPGASLQYTSVAALEVMPALAIDGISLYATYGADPLSDFTGSVNETTNEGSIAFNKAAPYWVRATYTDASQDYFYYGVGTLPRPGEPPPKKPEDRPKVIPTPSPDIVIVDANPYQVKDDKGNLVTENLKDTEPTYGSGTTKVEETSWANALAYLGGLPEGAKKHVELGGHGGPGLLAWGGTVVLDGSNLGQLNALQGKVTNLTFMACEVGQDPAFIQSVANLLGECSGYTKPVGGNGKDWFIWGDGELVTKTMVPEPTTLFCLAVALCGLAARRRRRLAFRVRKE